MNKTEAFDIIYELAEAHSIPIEEYDSILDPTGLERVILEKATKQKEALKIFKAFIQMRILER